MRKFLVLLSFLISALFGFAQDRLKFISSVAMPDPTWDVWGYIDSASGKEYAIVGSSGLGIVDITDAQNPVMVSFLYTKNIIFDHKVYKNFVYSVTGKGDDGSFGYIIDISDVKNPFIADSFPSAHNIHIDQKGFMYTSNPGVTIYDLNTNPLKPDSLWHGGNEGHDVCVLNDVLYDFHGRSGTNIYDVKDRKNPKLLSQILDPTIEYHHQGWLSKDGKYLYLCDELAQKWNADISVWDISDIENPERVGEFADNSATVHKVYAIDDWLYSSYYSAGVRIFDINDPINPKLSDEYDTTPDEDTEGFDGVYGVYPYALNNKVLASERAQGLFIFEFDSARQKQQDTILDFDIKVTYSTFFEDDLEVLIQKNTVLIPEEYFFFTMLDAQGRVVFTDTFLIKNFFQKTLRLPALQKGTYFAIIENNSKRVQRRVIKVK